MGLVDGGVVDLNVVGPDNGPITERGQTNVDQRD